MERKYIFYSIFDLSKLLVSDRNVILLQNLIHYNIWFWSNILTFYLATMSWADDILKSGIKILLSASINYLLSLISACLPAWASWLQAIKTTTGSVQTPGLHQDLDLNCTATQGWVTLLLRDGSHTGADVKAYQNSFYSAELPLIWYCNW